jgi:hypothetical protein
MHTYDEQKLSSLIDEVTKEFTRELAKAEESFKASKPEESDKKDEKKPEEKKESDKPEDKGNKESSEQAPSKEAAPQAESKEGQPQQEAGKESQAPQAAAPEAQDAHGYDDEDMQHMHSMYSSMSKPELKAHHDCIRKCMDGMAMSEQGMAKAEMEDNKEGEHRPNGGPTDGEAASKKTASSSDDQALEKSEKFLEVDTTSIKEVEILKSELQAAKAEADATKKNLEAVETFLKKFVEKAAPAGKAITSLDVIAKTESVSKAEKPLSKSEIDSKLLAKAKDQSLSKSDRDAINSYYFTKNIEKVSHLLK